MTELLRWPVARRILLLGAHADDIEIGCGGSVLDLLAVRDDVEVTWVVFSGAEDRAREARASASAFAERAGQLRVQVEDFRDGYFPQEGAEIKNAFERLKGEVVPDLVFTHHRTDRHQDHRVISDLTWNTFRSHLILEYEVPKYDGELASPNVFVPLSLPVLGRKVDLLMEHFGSQRSKQWFTPETFRALARLRGIESGGALSDYAEGFTCRKMVVGA